MFSPAEELAATEAVLVPTSRPMMAQSTKP